MLILAKFGKRAAAASLAGRRERETRPLAAADRRRHRPSREGGSTQEPCSSISRCGPEFHERVSASPSTRALPWSS